MKTILISSALVAALCVSFIFVGKPVGVVESSGVETPATLYREISDPKDRILYEHELQTNQFIGTQGFFGAARISVGFSYGHGNLEPLGLGWYSDGKWLQVTSRQLVGALESSNPRAYLLTADDEKDALECQRTGEMASAFRYMKVEVRGSKVQARGLTAFETYAVKRLQAGSRMVTWREPDHIRAMGAIRSEVSCTRCHEVSPGDLLGAFTYFIKAGGTAPFWPTNQKEIDKLAAVKHFPVEAAISLTRQRELRETKLEQEKSIQVHSDIYLLAQAGVVTDAMIESVREYREQHEKLVAERLISEPQELKIYKPVKDK